jgi:lipid A disaccharide synthetase
MKLKTEDGKIEIIKRIKIKENCYSYGNLLIKKMIVPDFGKDHKKWDNRTMHEVWRIYYKNEHTSHISDRKTLKEAIKAVKSILPIKKSFRIKE